MVLWFGIRSGEENWFLHMRRCWTQVRRIHHSRGSAHFPASRIPAELALDSSDLEQIMHVREMLARPVLKVHGALQSVRPELRHNTHACIGEWGCLDLVCPYDLRRKFLAIVYGNPYGVSRFCADACL